MFWSTLAGGFQWWRLEPALSQWPDSPCQLLGRLLVPVNAFDKSYYILDSGHVKQASLQKICYAVGMNTRKAESQDAPLLSALCADVQHLHASHHPEVFKMPSTPDFAETFFRDQLQDPLVHIFIAEQDGLAVGYIFCKLTERPANPFKHENSFCISIKFLLRTTSRGTEPGRP